MLGIEIERHSAAVTVSYLAGGGRSVRREWPRDAASAAAPQAAPRASGPRPRPRRRVRIPPSVERREASRLRNLRRRIPFIATRDSINTAYDRCGSLADRRGHAVVEEALAFPEWENERGF
ncbi:hypothetical protein HF086_016983 [Spodoptera exigua]|uniref:Uncharacterized protein n=1 Tax=Spodoptera exigua TaxID=7107 RepID=A0A922M5C4_SPOEX|nr:hypothetical protein HF086_016983 [Spodoptera exigua]